jgi:multicomponent Na+:H+ antiporter subunit G
MGAVLVIFGIMLQAGLSLAAVKLAAILLFLLLTSPTASNALASAALLAGLRPGDDATSQEEQSK